MERRDFMKLSAAGTVAGLSLATVNRAEAGSQPTPPGDLYYTEASQGRWAGKGKTHLPLIETSKDGGKTKVKVTTTHEMKAYEHYIVKHVLLDKDYKFLAEHLFDPTKEPLPVSEFTLDSYSGTLYALSLCNKHDLWLTSAEV